MFLGRDSALITYKSPESAEQLKKTERSPRPMESSRRDQSQLKSSSGEKQPSRRAETPPKEEFVAPAESPTHKESLERADRASEMERSSEEHNSARSQGGDSVLPKESAGVDRSSAEDSHGKGSRLSRKEISVQVDESTQYEQL